MAHGIGHTKGGRNTKLHAVCDGKGRPLVLLLGQPYRQWQNKGCQVRKGEKSSLVVFYKEFDAEEQ